MTVSSPEITLAVPDRDAALDLVRSLEGLGSAVVEQDGQWRVGLGPGDDATVTEILSAIEAWLSQSGLRSARVTLDGRTYLMEAPAPAETVSAELPAGEPRTAEQRPRSSRA